MFFIKLFSIQIIFFPFALCFISPLNIKSYTPIGIKACLTDSRSDGVTKIEFHANINKMIKPFENGDISGIVKSSSQGVWCFVDRITKIKIHDSVHYWVKVYYNNGDVASDIRSKIFYRKFVKDIFYVNIT